MSTSYQIKDFASLDNPPAQPSTKFGGNPDWLQTPEWPISRSTGKPMAFIGQIKIDKEQFPFAKAEWAYLFISEFDDYVDGTWESEGGENAVILQPGDNSHIQTVNQSQGLTLSDIAYYPTIEMITEPIVEDADGFIENDSHYSCKIGGIPAFIQDEEYPETEDEWHFFLQIPSDVFPFTLNFGDCGTAYAFLSSTGDKARLLWQCH